MRRSLLILLLCFTGCLVMTGLVLRQEDLRQKRATRSAMAVLFGDGRRLFANHFLSKADAYFHRGRYPSIFDVDAPKRENFLQESLQDDPAGQEEADTTCAECGADHPDQEHAHEDDHDHDHDHVDEHGHELGVASGEEEEHEHTEACAHAEPGVRPQDWIARLAMRFEPDRHVHLEEGGEREMLPWVRLAVEMDPQNIDAYTIGGYWLRRMGKPDDAARFLREGLRNNPDSAEIYFELGRLQESTGTDPRRVIRLYTLSAEKWEAAAAQEEEPDLMALAQILGRLGRAYETVEDWDRALYCYRRLKQIALNPEGVQKLIDAIEVRQGASSL